MTKSIRIYVMLSSVFALVLALSAPLWGGVTGKIAGRVTDAETDEPLPGANVVIQGTIMGGATDSDGFYFIINVAPGGYTVTATMMGYETVNKTDVVVSVDRTVTVDYSLSPTVLIGQEVTVLAEREIVPMDISASHIVAGADQIARVPMVTDIAEYINLMAGIENDLVRGGGLDQTQFMVDGMLIVDNRANKPMMMVNLSSVEEINIIKGGFNAEYGNVRSGLINVVTKEGSPDKYGGSIDFRYSPPHLKHSGESVFDPNVYYLRPYLDPGVMWVGTANGTWDEETQDSYPSFVGWNAVSAGYLADDDPINDKTPEECRDMFMYLHTTEGSAALGQREGEDGTKPDWNVDASLNGPVPLVGKYLGDLTFFASYRDNWEMFGLPMERQFYKEDNFLLKLTSRISPYIKLRLEGMLSGVESVASDIFSGPPVQGGAGIFSTDIASGSEYGFGSGGNMYFPSSLNPWDINSTMFGLSLDHILSPSTFYNLRISNFNSANTCDGPYKWRDSTTVRYFGNTPVDEAPYGFAFFGGVVTMTDGMIYQTKGAYARDWSSVNTWNAKFDLTSQVNKYNQFKAGFEFNYDDLHEYSGSINYWYLPADEPFPPQRFTGGYNWTHQPIRFGSYVQDKLEFEGMIANFGLRLDYNDPNCEWYSRDDRYSQYYSARMRSVFEEEAPKETAEGHMKISPRLGISHPISDRAKLYFNYGHFYSMPSSNQMYRISPESPFTRARVSALGNPWLELPKTVAYELGFEYNFLNLFLIHLAGYYKDVSDQTGSASYVSYDGSVSYTTSQSNNYEDIRGFELQINKRWGKWITGWLNYNYIVTTSGYFGRRVYYEDPRTQRLYGLENPYQEKPLPRPYLRANLQIMSPEDLGPMFAGIRPLGGIQISMLYFWKTGSYTTWDPLQTYQLQNNLQWKNRWSIDLRVSKRLNIGGANVELFADIENLLYSKNIYSQGFANSPDRQAYYESLHLPMYKGQEYQDAGYVGGNDQLGDVKSDDKPYIDMPNRGFLTYLDVRSVFFGLRFNF
ncbi:carboxypeptidase regulatory-like domain-containing protein [Candidatus Neomarinimicrobiota bacterium]